jgi:hypothetical protein
MSQRSQVFLQSLDGVTQLASYFILLKLHYLLELFLKGNDTVTYQVFSWENRRYNLLFLLLFLFCEGFLLLFQPVLRNLTDVLDIAPLGLFKHEGQFFTEEGIALSTTEPPCFCDLC